MSYPLENGAKIASLEWGDIPARDVGLEDMSYPLENGAEVASLEWGDIPARDVGLEDMSYLLENGAEIASLEWGDIPARDVGLEDTSQPLENGAEIAGIEWGDIPARDVEPEDTSYPLENGAEIASLGIGNVGGEILNVLYESVQVASPDRRQEVNVPGGQAMKAAARPVRVGDIAAGDPLDEIVDGVDAITTNHTAGEQLENSVEGITDEIAGSKHLRRGGGTFCVHVVNLVDEIMKFQGAKRPGKQARATVGGDRLEEVADVTTEKITVEQLEN